MDNPGNYSPPLLPNPGNNPTPPFYKLIFSPEPVDMQVKIRLFETPTPQNIDFSRSKAPPQPANFQLFVSFFAPNILHSADNFKFSIADSQPPPPPKLDTANSPLKIPA